VRNPWQIWLIYLASLAIVVAGVGWLSVRAIDADRAEASARQQAELEEKTRLALWRMDSNKAPLIFDENARAYFAYMTVYPAERAYGRMFNNKAPAPSPMLLSPLASPIDPEVLVHFQFDPEGKLTSPQVPLGRVREQTVPRFLSVEQVQQAENHLKRVRDLVRVETLLAQLPPVEAPPTEFQLPPVDVAATPSANQGSPPLAMQANSARPAPRNQSQQPIAQGDSSSGAQSGYGLSQQATGPQLRQQQAAQQFAAPNDPAQQQRARGDNEFQARSNYVAQSLNTSTLRAGNFNSDLNQLISPDDIGAPTAAAEVRASRIVPQWIERELVLARRVSVNGREYVQGCLLDWTLIRKNLLADIADLLPHADLVPFTGVPDDGLSHLMASLPVRLLPGDVPAVETEGLSPTHQSLIVTWASMLAGALAVAILLQGVIALSERRAAFVSAVTHELRTPLTTFRMYAEMLAEGMVPDEESRRRYLGTLRVEAERLTHLVENVLAYARLERGSPAGRIAPVSVATILHQADRLADRAAQAGLELLIEADEATLCASAAADASAVEQILFNLVDNACKYAPSAKDRSLHLESYLDSKSVYFRVRDHGPGIPADKRGRLFQPFRKSADDAARSAPGVGLGLALSRRLARQMKGDLRYEQNGVPGASFVLTLPRA
jgi:signal transduction histidine kinase